MAWYNPHVEQEDYWIELEQGTTEWKDYWQEQIDRCLYGYTSKEHPDIFIEGRYYFVLNFCKAQTKTGWINPEFRDYQNEYFEFFEDNDFQGVNTGMKKARRKGFSFLSLMGIILYDMIFYTATNDGIAVGDEETLTSMRAMLIAHMEEVDPFFRLQTTVNNKDRIEFGWYEKTDESAKPKKKGTGNQLRMELFSSNVELFKGLILRHVLFEEIGKFQKLRQTYAGTKDCFMDGAVQFGTGIFGGTGGDVEKGSADFMYMSMNPDKFNLRWMFVPATKGLPPFIDNLGRSLEDPVELKVAQEVAERTGQSVDLILKGAKAWWKEQEEMFKKHQDKTELYQFYQNMPTKVEHIFLTKGSGVFNQLIIEDRENKIEEVGAFNGWTRGYFKFSKGWLEIYKANNGWHHSCIEFIPHRDGPVLIRHYPSRDGRDRFGLDPYGQEESVTSDSIGVLYGFRLKKSLSDTDGHKIVFRFADRPANIKDFHSQAFAALVWYDAQVNLEANMAAEFIAYMELMKAESYMKPRGKSFDENHNERKSEAKNKYGFRMTPPVKKIMVNKLSEYLNEYADEIDDPDLLRDYKFWGSINTDFAIAFGACLMFADEYYAEDGIHQMNQEQEETETSLVKYKRVNGQIVAVVG